MQVEMSLAELLINAIAHGSVRGVQFKRGWSDERATFDDLNKVIAKRLDGARAVAVQEALHKLQDEHPGFKLRRALIDIRDNHPCRSCDAAEVAERAVPPIGTGKE